ncbi:hypothetical protein [Nonomuraea turkmeniaca]|uniref:hypothetical protein n=1 Tax=Nonomuraea turkmeniaca TaxID=103838 RepID=UPI003CCC52D0
MPLIGQAAVSSPSRSSHGRLSHTVCARHSPADSAEDASSVTTRPTTQRLATSMAAVT